MIDVISRWFSALLLVSAGLLMLIQSSCSTSNSAELRQIDSLIVIAEQQFALIDAINRDSMKMILDHAGNKLSVLQSATPDSLILTEYIRATSLYGDISKAMKRGLPAMESHKTALTESIQQLRNLRHDIKKDLINDTLLIGYLNAEKSILNQIKSESDVVLNNIRMKSEFFRQSQNNIDSFIQLNFQ